jgi:hypothetical protein
MSSVFATRAVTDTNYHHVAVTKNGGEVVFYLDGVADPVGSYAPVFAFGNPIAIGARGGDYAASFLGAIDEVSIYNRPLNAGEIQLVYSAGTAGKCIEPTPPLVVVQPADRSVFLGSSVSFSVVASGTSPLSYQWQFNGTNIPGSTGSSHVIPSAQYEDAGSYRVLVSNSVGAAASSNAVLTVSPVTCTLPPAGILGWWRGEGNALDQKGTNNGVLAGNTTYGPGLVGQAFVFDGASDGVNLANPTSLQIQDFTIEAWIKRASTIQASKDPYNSGIIISYPFGGYGFGITDDGRLFLTKNGESNVSSSRSVADTSFHHVAVTKVGSLVRFYIDGIGEVAPAYNPGFVFNGPPAIGGRGGDFAASFLGSIDEVSLYNRPLDGEEISSIYNSGTAGKCVAFAPSILVQPVSRTVTLASNVTFTVVADGSTPLVYQWVFKGAVISDATNSSLTLSNVQFDQAGNYAVVVTNAFGSAVSSNALLSVVAPGVCAQPPPGLVSWWRGEANAFDQTGTNNGLLMGNAAFGQGRVGTGFVFDGQGDAVSLGNPAGLRLQDFTIEAWVKRDSTNRASLDPYQSGIILSYAWGGFGFAYSDDGRLFLTQNGSSSVFSTFAVTDTDFHHVAVAKQGSSVKFYLDGVEEVAPAYNPTFTFSGEIAIGARGGDYAASFLGSIDEVSIYARQLTATEIQSIFLAKEAGKCAVPVLPTIVTHPVDQTVIAGNTVGLTVEARGTPPLAYQWRLDGTNIPGATTSAYSITSAQVINSGIYSAIITNDAGSVVSSNAVLTVVEVPVSILSHPVSQSVFQGAQVSFSVTVTGSPPYAFQWKLDGINLSGATASSLALSNVTVAQAGEYSVFVSNPFGSASSSNAVLTVTPTFVNFFDDFEPGLHSPLWAKLTGTATATNYGGYVSASNALYFAGSGSRSLATCPLNTLGGGFVQFWLKFPNGISTVWDRPELPMEGIVLEFSGNNGTNWVQMGRYDTPDYYTWKQVSTQIPSGAKTPATLFRWRQLSNSGATSDHWALDDVAVVGTAIPPSIVGQPQPATVVSGSTARLSVTAVGSVPLFYQWQRNGTNVGDGTQSSLVLPNIQMADAGFYSVVVTNNAGSVVSSNAQITVVFPPPLVRVVNVDAAAGGTVSVPIEITANGNENAVGFSLSFNTSLLTYTGVTVGGGATGANLIVNESQTANGKVGLVLGLGPGTALNPGLTEIALVQFQAAVVANATTTSIAFADAPIARQISDVAGSAVTGAYSNGIVAIAAAEYEGDVTPRPFGDRDVTVTDWAMLNRYVARLDFPTNAAEFQRADCAPRSTKGDGFITVIDWVQAGRYAARLDPLTVLGGPSSLSALGPIPGGGMSKLDLNPRQLKVGNGTGYTGDVVSIAVTLEAQGDENACGFSLAFDPALLQYTGASPGSGATGTTLTINDVQAGAGRVGFLLGANVGATIPAGSREMVKVTFRNLGSGPASVQLSPGDQPIPRQVASANAEDLTTGYVPGAVTIQAPPALLISREQQSVTLSWPAAASGFLLQETGPELSVSSKWTNSAVTLGTNGTSLTVTVPLSEGAKFYRLLKP